MKYLINFLGFLVKATLAAFAIASLLIFLAMLTTLVGLELTLPPSMSFFSDKFDFLTPVVNATKSFMAWAGDKLNFIGPAATATQSFIRGAGDFFLLWGHRILIYAIIGGMIYFILSILRHW